MNLTALLCLAFANFAAAAPRLIVALTTTPDLPNDHVFAVSINNSGVVAGYEGTGIDANVIPLVWVNGSPQKLEYPSGYTVTTVLSINNSANVLGTAVDANGNQVFILWQVGQTLIYSPPLPVAGAPLLNNANHVLTSTTNGEIWIWNSKDGDNTLVSVPAGTCSAPIAFNDADQFLALNSATCTASGQYHYDLIDSSGAATPFAAPDFHYTIVDINNRGEAVAGLTSGVFFWSRPAAFHLIDPQNYVFEQIGKINNAGAILGEFLGINLYQNGNYQYPDLPAPFNEDPQPTQFNDANQVIVVEPAVTGVYTPQASMCATDVTRELTILPGAVIRDPNTGRYAQTIRVVNPTSAAFSGPTSLGFIGLPATVSLFAPSGATLCSDAPQGTGFITSSAALAPMGEIDFKGDYLNVEGARITYTPVVLTGAGGR